MSVYYNEHDPFAAAWLRELIKAGEIPDGFVDTRDIQDVAAADLDGYAQCHFFAGIGGWALALKLAGWSDRPIWTGSCPCQPYSVASVGHGGATGHADKRDLWPVFAALIAECRPDLVVGEQVISAIKWGWMDRTAVDLESEGYAVAPLVLRADAYGADHERQRLYWLADASRQGRQGYQPLECLPVSASQALPINSHSFARARRALDGDCRDLLPCDGLSVVMERHALKGYGNAIVPQVAAEVLKAFLSLEES